MIRYEPIPLLEATLFLANWAAQISWNTDIEKTFGFCSKSTKQTLEEYSRIFNRAGTQTRRRHHRSGVNRADAVCPPASQ